ncbi:MAG TPA: hypothetical protein VFA71_12845, partial [Terriglobales bacterium]|nr:hypothetical protein [Terriglobales bacterium]
MPELIIGAALECFDFTKGVDPGDIFPVLEEQRKNQTSDWQKHGDYVRFIKSMDIMAFTPNCAPFSIFPFNAKFCVELMIGVKAYISYLNYSAVAREFEANGWKIEKTMEQMIAEGQSDIAAFMVSKGAYIAYVPAADLMRIQMELLLPNIVIAAIEARFQEGSKGRDLNRDYYELIIYDREPECWTSYLRQVIIL